MNRKRTLGDITLWINVVMKCFTSLATVDKFNTTNLDNPITRGGIKSGCLCI